MGYVVDAAEKAYHADLPKDRPRRMAMALAAGLDALMDDDPLEVFDEETGEWFEVVPRELLRAVLAREDGA